MTLLWGESGGGCARLGLWLEIGDCLCDLVVGAHYPLSALIAIFGSHIPLNGVYFAGREMGKGDGVVLAVQIRYRSDRE